MPITRSDKNQEYRNGQLVGEELTVIDVTEDAVRVDIHAKARAALTTNRTFLAIANPTNAQMAAQVKALTRQNDGVIKLLLALDGARDLLRDEAE